MPDNISENRMQLSKTRFPFRESHYKIVYYVIKIQTL